jgi:hypothetical protein
MFAVSDHLEDPGGLTEIPQTVFTEIDQFHAGG